MTTPAQANFPLDAKKRLLDLGLTVTGLAKELGLSRTAVTTAIHHTNLPGVRARIARRLQLKIKK